MPESPCLDFVALEAAVTALEAAADTEVLAVRCRAVVKHVPLAELEAVLAYARRGLMAHTLAVEAEAARQSHEAQAVRLFEKAARELRQHARQV